MLGWSKEDAKVLPQVEELSTVWKKKKRGGGVCGQVEKKGGRGEQIRLDRLGPTHARQVRMVRP
jgi:hypothetical protein